MQRSCGCEWNFGSRRFSVGPVRRGRTPFRSRVVAQAGSHNFCSRSYFFQRGQSCIFSGSFQGRAPPKACEYGHRRVRQNGEFLITGRHNGDEDVSRRPCRRRRSGISAGSRARKHAARAPEPSSCDLFSMERLVRWSGALPPWFRRRPGTARASEISRASATRRFAPARVSEPLKAAAAPGGRLPAGCWRCTSSRDAEDSRSVFKTVGTGLLVSTAGRGKLGLDGRVAARPPAGGRYSEVALHRCSGRSGVCLLEQL